MCRGVRGFVGTTHNTYVDDFKKLDSSRLRLATDRVRRIHAERTIAAMNKFPEQESVIRSEAAKLCDNIGIIHNGRLIAEGTLGELRERHCEDDLEEIFVRVVQA